MWGVEMQLLEFPFWLGQYPVNTWHPISFFSFSFFFSFFLFFFSFSIFFPPWFLCLLSELLSPSLSYNVAKLPPPPPPPSSSFFFFILFPPHDLAQNSTLPVTVDDTHWPLRLTNLVNASTRSRRLWRATDEPESRGRSRCASMFFSHISLSVRQFQST